MKTVSAKQIRYIGWVYRKTGWSPVAVTRDMTQLEANWLIQSMQKVLGEKRRMTRLR